MRDLHSSSAEIAAAGPSTAVFAIGAIEQHSIHLPLCTDWFWAGEIGLHVARELEEIQTSMNGLIKLPLHMSKHI